MEDRNLDDFTVEEISRMLKDAVDAVIIVDGAADKYRTLVRHGFFEKYLKDREAITI